GAKLSGRASAGAAVDLARNWRPHYREGTHPGTEADMAVAASTDLRREGGGRSFMLFVYLGLHLGAAAIFWVEIRLLDLILAFVLLQARGFCVSGGYHRGLAHHSYRTGRVVRFLLSVGACTALRGGPLWWVALHRFHHRH